MYFSWLHKKKPENCSINVLKKRILCPFRVLEFFTTVRNDRIFLFSRTLPVTYFGINSFIFVDFTRNHPKNWSINVLKKRFLSPVRVLEFFTTVRKYRIFLFSRTLPETCVRKNLCILVDYTRKRLKIAVSMSSKNDLWVRFGFSNFLRLFETTEFFFFLGLFQGLASA